MTSLQFSLAILAALVFILVLAVVLAGAHLSKNKSDFPKLDPNYPPNDILAKPFLEALPDIIVSMDIDTTRFPELVWAHRAAHGEVNTGAFLYQIIGSEKVPIQHFIKLFDKYNLQGKFSSSVAWRGFLFNPGQSKTPALSISLTKYNPNEPYAIIIVGEKQLVDEWETYFLEKYQAPSIKKVTMITGVARDGQLRMHHRVIDTEAMDVGYDEFYPTLEGGVDALVEEFQASKQNVLLIVGPTGSGKTTLVRTIILKSKYENYGICNDQNALEGTEITDWIANFPNPSLISIEDADQFVATRKSGNKNMAALLNLTEGLVQADRKIVIVTNLESLNDVEPALMRSGRMFRVLFIGNMTVEQANIARAKLGKPALPDDVPFPAKISLAEALNHENTHNNVHNTPRKQVGLIRQ